MKISTFFLVLVSSVIYAAVFVGIIMATPITTVGGGSSSGGASVNVGVGNVLYSSLGTNISGSNALMISFNGATAVFTNGSGGGLVFRGSGFAFGTNNVDASTHDYIFKGFSRDDFYWQSSGTDSKIWLGNGLGNITEKWYRTQDGSGIQLQYNGQTDNWGYFGNRQGNMGIYGNANVSIGTGSSGTAITSYMDLSNSLVNARVNFNGSTNLMTNFANLFNRHAMIDHSASVVDVGSNLVFFANTAAWKCGGWAQSDPGSNDTFHAYVVLEAGTYTFYALGLADNNRGQQKWSLVNVGGTTNATWSMDWYAASTVVNTRKIQSVTVPVDGRYKITSTTTNKNASSTSFYIFLDEYGFTQ